LKEYFATFVLVYITLEHVDKMSVQSS